MADPLSVSASIVTLIAAGSKLVSLIARIRDPSQSLIDIQTELASLRIVVNGLKSFVERTRNIDTARADLIPVQDVITVFTQIVLVHTEIEAFVKARAGAASFSDRTREALGHGSAAAAKRLLEQLQRHKLSLSLVLQIVQWCCWLPAF